jgi:hypothetical protein
LSVPPLPVAASAIEEGQKAVETTAPQVALEPPAVGGPGGVEVVVVLDEDSAPPPPVGDYDVAMTSVPEPLPAANVPEPSPATQVQEPSPTTGVALTSSAAVTMTVEEVMELATSRYIDFPGIGIVDLDASELPSNDWEMLEVATERMFVEPSILETIVSVSRALH